MTQDLQNQLSLPFDLGSLVLQVDTPHYFATAGKGQGRLMPAVNFEVLSQVGQKEAELKAYHQPVLMGTGIGAALAYIALAESPSDTFAGAVSDGFCAVMASDASFRRGNGLETDGKWQGPGVRLLPNPAIQNPWLLLERPGLRCASGPPTDFLKTVSTAKLIPAPAGVPPQEAWKKQLPKALPILDEFQRQMDAKMATRGEVKDLPLVEVPAQGPAKDALAVIVTGSGGFVGLDRKMGNQLTLRGVPVVGLSSLGYFWQVRDPQGSSEDLARILKHYMAAWHKSRAIVVGYSQGADVVPFMVSRLPADLRSRIGAVALIGPDANAQFDMPPDGWVSKRPRLPGVRRPIRKPLDSRAEERRASSPATREVVRAIQVESVLLNTSHTSRSASIAPGLRSLPRARRRWCRRASRWCS